MDASRTKAKASGSSASKVSLAARARAQGSGLRGQLGGAELGEASLEAVDLLGFGTGVRMVGEMPNFIGIYTSRTCEWLISEWLMMGLYMWWLIMVVNGD